MSPKKKLLESDDFDKRKKLFTSSDFDKESDENNPLEHPQDGKNGDSDVSGEKSKSNFGNWILLGFLGVVVVCTIGYFIFSKSDDTGAIEPASEEPERVEETVGPSDFVVNQEEVTEKGLTADENEASNNTDGQKPQLRETPVPHIATTTNSKANNAIVSNDVEAEAMKVIRGDYGIGQERKDKLGSKYQTIQSRVNELKREGIF